jgi:hypothetical protein
MSRMHELVLHLLNDLPAPPGVPTHLSGNCVHPIRGSKVGCLMADALRGSPLQFS